MTARGGTVLVVALAVAVLVSGCAGAEAQVVADPPATVVASEPASPAPPSEEPAEPVVRPELADLVASPDGLGPLLIGPLDAESAAGLMVEWDEDYCAGMGLTDPGEWVSTYPLDEQNRPPFGTTIRDEVLRIDIWTPEVRTAEGIRIGSTRDELLAAYGTALRLVAADTISELYARSDSDSTLLFEVAIPGASYQRWSEAEWNTVWSIRIQGADSPTTMIARSEDRAGGCL